MDNSTNYLDRNFNVIFKEKSTVKLKKNTSHIAHHDEYIYYCDYRRAIIETRIMDLACVILINIIWFIAKNIRLDNELITNVSSVGWITLFSFWSLITLPIVRLLSRLLNKRIVVRAGLIMSAFIVSFTPIFLRIITYYAENYKSVFRFIVGIIIEIIGAIIISKIIERKPTYKIITIEGELEFFATAIVVSVLGIALVLFGMYLVFAFFCEHTLLCIIIFILLGAGGVEGGTYAVGYGAGGFGWFFFL